MNSGGQGLKGRTKMGGKSKMLKHHQNKFMQSLGGVKCMNDLTGTSSCIISLIIGSVQLKIV